MATLIEKYFGKKVTVTLRTSTLLPVIGVLLECDNLFARVDQDENKGELLIPITAILHIQTANG